MANNFVEDICQSWYGAFRECAPTGCGRQGLKSNIIARFNSVPPIGMLLL
jgi:hypothetical protein